MGKRKFQDFIPDECHRRYSCVHCRAHLANHDELISKVCPCWGKVDWRAMHVVVFITVKEEDLFQ